MKIIKNTECIKEFIELLLCVVLLNVVLLFSVLVETQYFASQGMKINISGRRKILRLYKCQTNPVISSGRKCIE